MQCTCRWSLKNTLQLLLAELLIQSMSSLLRVFVEFRYHRLFSFDRLNNAAIFICDGHCYFSVSPFHAGLKITERLTQNWRCPDHSSNPVREGVKKAKKGQNYVFLCFLHSCMRFRQILETYFNQST